MSAAEIVDRLAALPNLAAIPRCELEWLVAHGALEVHEAGTVLAPKGRRIEKLWIILSGHIAVRVDRGAGSRRVMGWRTGEVSGMLPFSRMTGPPGDNYLEEPAELLTLHERHFSELMRQCPAFTAYTVHLMLDRARNFNTSDLHDEKMIALGKLAAGLAHELNNPASATLRGAKLLFGTLDEMNAALRQLGTAGLTEEMFGTIEQACAACLAIPAGPGRSPIEQADWHDEIAGWLERHGAEPAHAAPLADTSLTVDRLDVLASAIPGDRLAAALRWIAAESATRGLATEISRAATRIVELVDAVKNFTHMDNLAGPESLEVKAGLSDTINILAAKVNSKHATVTLDVATALPYVRANGADLNQIWVNLIDNALDAIADSGRIEVSARRELDRVVVRVIDDGPGIAPETLPLVFDPFFTTKPPGQGTGLGLEVARRLVRRWHGDITVQSRPGRTEFAVSLQVEASEPASSSL